MTKHLLFGGRWGEPFLNFITSLMSCVCHMWSHVTWEPSKTKSGVWVTWELAYRSQGSTGWSQNEGFLFLLSSVCEILLHSDQSIDQCGEEGIHGSVFWRGNLELLALKGRGYSKKKATPTPSLLQAFLDTVSACSHLHILHLSKR